VLEEKIHDIRDQIKAFKSSAPPTEALRPEDVETLRTELAGLQVKKEVQETQLKRSIKGLEAKLRNSRYDLDKVNLHMREKE
jgi:hypothetical protein